MRSKELFVGLGGLLLFGVVVILGLSLIVIFIKGGAWASSRILPIFAALAWISFGLEVLVFLPLSIPRATRKFSSTVLYVMSYVFGATVWMEGFLLTLSLWGVGAVVIGVLLLGVGVVPIAMIATLIKGMWLHLLELVFLTILTFGTRGGAIALMGSLED